MVQVREAGLLIRSLILVALVTVLSALAACTASTYWQEWDTAPVRRVSPGAAAAPQLATHIVASGDTAYSIARRYGVSLQDLKSANGLDDGFNIHPGESLRLPVELPAVATAAPTPKPVLLARRDRNAGRGQMIWPVTGPVISAFGPKDDGRFNEGVNIAIADGTPVWAAADGLVTYAGNEIRGYGNLVLIRHDNGLVTAYAHNEKLKVRKGARVHQGDVIALSGATGTVATPQVHFEIRRKGHAVDPLSVLGGTAEIAAR